MTGCGFCEDPWVRQVLTEPMVVNLGWLSRFGHVRVQCRLIRGTWGRQLTGRDLLPLPSAGHLTRECRFEGTQSAGDASGLPGPFGPVCAQLPYSASPLLGRWGSSVSYTGKGAFKSHRQGQAQNYFIARINLRELVKDRGLSCPSERAGRVQDASWLAPPLSVSVSFLVSPPFLPSSFPLCSRPSSWVSLLPPFSLQA